MNNKKIFNLIILDESGSMDSICESVISGLNEVVQTIQNSGNKYPELEQYVTFVTFNSMGIKKIHDRADVKNLKEIDRRLYKPNAMTPLFDAMGTSINELKNFLNGDEDANVLVTIFTDGLENASREFTGKDIKMLIEYLKEKNWTFTYIGTDHDVEKFADSISVDNNISYMKSNIGVSDVFMKEKIGREKYIESIAFNKKAGKDYFEKK